MLFIHFSSVSRGISIKSSAPLIFSYLCFGSFFKSTCYLHIPSYIPVVSSREMTHLTLHPSSCCSGPFCHISQPTSQQRNSIHQDGSAIISKWGSERNRKLSISSSGREIPHCSGAGGSSGWTRAQLLVCPSIRPSTRAGDGSPILR